jgi:WD40 repeat protein
MGVLLMATLLKSLAANPGGFRVLAATLDGVYVASAGDDNSVRVWDRNSGAVKLTLTDHTAPVNAVAFSPDGKYLASGSEDRTIRVYQFPSGTPAGTYTSHSGIVTGVAFTPDSKYLVSSSEDKTLRVTQVSTGDNVYIYNSYPYPQLSVDVVGNYVLSGAADGMMILWDLKTSGGAQLAAPQLRTPANNVTGIAPQVTFQWDAVPSGETYKLQVSTDATFATTNIVDETGLTGTSKDVTTLATNTKYYWRVKAEGGGGESPWSQVWNFTTSNGGPSTPVQVSPANLATDQPQSLTLSWNASPGATYYRIEVSNFGKQTKPDGTFISKWKSANITEKTADPNRPDTFYVLTGMDKSTTYYWHVLAQNTVAPSTWSPVWEFKTTGPSDVTEAGGGVMRQGYLLEEARPNPVAASTIIRFVTPKRGHVRLSVVDERGGVVAVLADRTVETGEHTATFDATSLGAGVYFTRLEADGVVMSGKVVVTK